MSIRTQGNPSGGGPGSINDRAFFGQPKGLASLFFVAL